MAPRALGLGATQITFVVLTSLASTMVTGSVTAFNVAFTLLQIPIGLIGVPLGVVVLPSLSRVAALGNLEEFSGLVSRALRLIVYVMVPVTGISIVLRDELVRLLFGYGKFDQAAIDLTAATFAAFLVGLTAHALIAVLARAFYARHDTRTPVAAAIVAVVVNTTLGDRLRRAARAARSRPRDRDRGLDRDDPARRAPEAVAAGARPPAGRIARAAVPDRRGRRVARGRGGRGRPGPRARLRPVTARARRPDDGRRCCLAPDIRRPVARLADHGAPRDHRAHARPRPQAARGMTATADRDAGGRRPATAATPARTRRPELPPPTRPAPRARMTPRGTRSPSAATRAPTSS